MSAFADPPRRGDHGERGGGDRGGERGDHSFGGGERGGYAGLTRGGRPAPQEFSSRGGRAYGGGNDAPAQAQPQQQDRGNGFSGRVFNGGGGGADRAVARNDRGGRDTHRDYNPGSPGRVFNQGPNRSDDRRDSNWNRDNDRRGDWSRGGDRRGDNGWSHNVRGWNDRGRGNEVRLHFSFGAPFYYYDRSYYRSGFYEQGYIYRPMRYYDGYELAPYECRYEYHYDFWQGRPADIRIEVCADRYGEPYVLEESAVLIGWRY